MQCSCSPRGSCRGERICLDAQGCCQVDVHVGSIADQLRQLCMDLRLILLTTGRSQQA